VIRLIPYAITAALSLAGAAIVCALAVEKRRNKVIDADLALAQPDHEGQPTK
jgi:hypothetical protein